MKNLELQDWKLTQWHSTKDEAKIWSGRECRFLVKHFKFWNQTLVGLGQLLLQNFLWHEPSILDYVSPTRQKLPVDVGVSSDLKDFSKQFQQTHSNTFNVDDFSSEKCAKQRKSRQHSKKDQVCSEEDWLHFLFVNYFFISLCISRYKIHDPGWIKQMKGGMEKR